MIEHNNIKFSKIPVVSLYRTLHLKDRLFAFLMDALETILEDEIFLYSTWNNSSIHLLPQISGVQFSSSGRVNEWKNNVVRFESCSVKSLKILSTFI